MCYLCGSGLKLGKEGVNAFVNHLKHLELRAKENSAYENLKGSWNCGTLKNPNI